MPISKPELREKQIGQLAHYIANPKTLDLSDPSTGKTPPICVYAYWNWTKNGKKTMWTMPKSLLNKNYKEMMRFTDFKPEDIVILTTDHLPMTKKWTGPVVTRVRTQRGFAVKWMGKETDTVAIRNKLDHPVNFIYKEGNDYKTLGRPVDGMKLEIEPIRGPNGLPRKVSVEVEEQARDMIKYHSDAKVFIMTFAFATAHWERLLEANPELDVELVDEIHVPGGFSTPGTQATDAFMRRHKRLSRYVGMTGTLINGRLDSAYPSIAVIESRYYGSIQGFMFEHAAVVDDYNRVTVWKNHDKLRQIIERHSIRRTYKEVYGDEPVAFFTEYADIDPKVRESYDQFHLQALLELDDGRVLDGSSPGVALLRAGQLLSHPETLLNGIPEYTGKDERIQLHLAEGKKTLIFAAFKPEQYRLAKMCKEFGLRTALINSDVDLKDRVKIDEAAQRGELDVIVASGPTTAVGFNWEMFDLVIFASIDFLDTNILQAYRRASRGTRTSILRVIYLRYRDSVDDRKYQIVKMKSQLANLVDPNRPVLEFTEAE